MRLGRLLREGILQACRSALPNEACGLLAGIEEPTLAIAVRNADQSPSSFSMEPEQQILAFSEIDMRGLELLATWHSHPGGPAIPSTKDQRIGALYPDAAMLVISLAQEPPEIRGWRFGGRHPEEIPIEEEA